MGWQICSKRPNILTLVVGRVEKLAAASSAIVNFTPLRAAIRSLQFASLKLDAERFVAERFLRDQLRKLPKDKPKDKQKDGCLKRFIHRLNGFFKEESNDAAVSAPMFVNEKSPLKLGRAPDFGNDQEVNVEERSWPRLPWPRKPKHPQCLPPKLIKALKAVRKINQKLAAFERGFIHEDGIKDREWYRHLGVAPGKWLGKTLLGVGVSVRSCVKHFLQGTVPRHCQLSLRQLRSRRTTRLQTTRLSD
jgi:N-acetylated-alpha-linked acidic dipeptidase